MSALLAVEIPLESSRLAVVAGPQTWISGQLNGFENYEPTLLNGASCEKLACSWKGRILSFSCSPRSE